MKKLFIKTVIYLFILLLLPYLYFLWQAKQGVDYFLLSHPMDGELEYQWIWIDLDGQISLYDINFYQDSSDPVFTAQKIEIIPTSIFDLLNAKEHIIYKEYPAEIRINLINGKSNQGSKFFALFSVDYDPDILDFLYPQECSTKIDKRLPFLSFAVASRFKIHPTADESSVSFEFSSRVLTNLKGSFKINNFSEEGTNASFISGLSLSFTDLVWIQQNTQKCLAALNLDKAEFTQRFNKQLIETAKLNNLLINENASLSYVDFIYVPQKIQLDFDLKVGKKFSQITFQPVYQYQDKMGLTILLNDHEIGTLFQAYDNMSETIEPVVTKDLTTNKTVKSKNRNLTINGQNLNQYLGSKILINLYNGKEIIGYLEMANNQSLKIRQLKYKGKTILPFAYQDIKSILLLRAEN